MTVFSRGAGKRYWPLTGLFAQWSMQADGQTSDAISGGVISSYSIWRWRVCAVVLNWTRRIMCNSTDRTFISVLRMGICMRSGMGVQYVSYTLMAVGDINILSGVAA